MSQPFVSTPWRTALLILACANALLLCLQPIIAILFLNGIHQAFPVHDIGAKLATLLTFSCSIVSIFAARRGAAAQWLSIAFFSQFLLEALQIKLGELAVRSGHIPHGALLLLGGLALALHAFRYPLPADRDITT